LALLAAQGRSLADVDVFAVAAGPGSFTGLRIGIAAMQGLAFAVARPIVGVSALDALALSARDAVTSGTQYVASWMNAQRDEVFAALFRCGINVEGSPALELVDEPTVDGPGEILARWRERGFARVLFAGDGALHYRAWLDHAPDLVEAVVDPVPVLAPAIATLALTHVRAGGVSSPHAMVPIYIRRPDAELARDRRAVEA
jgi:tRNA threonylcarbamoyladenosine biosynthesis protein TsaB